LSRRKIAAVSRGKDVAYLRKLAAAVRPLMKNADRYRSLKIYVADSTLIDARCFPGGTLIFSRGLLEAAGSEAALLAMVGHELSHLDRGHVLAHLQRIRLAQRTFAAPAGFSLQRFFSTGPVLLRMFTHPFRPECEAEADRDGAKWAYRAGYEPREMAGLFLKLEQQFGDRRRFLPEFLRSHPLNRDRYNAVISLCEQLKKRDPKEKLYVGRENLRRRIPRDERRYQE
jgi:predicted Zn-dependent protease